ncbi:MAG: glycosyltransferase family 9 protein [Pirellulales bacterium]
MYPPRSIVIVKLSAIGDVLHAVPAVVALKCAFPSTKIGWVVEGRAADVLAGHPAIDHLFRLPRGWLKSPKAILDYRQQVRSFRPDVTLDMQGLFKSMIGTILSGAWTRIGYSKPESREQSWLAYTRSVRPLACHVVERHCELLSPLGVRPDSIGFQMPDWPASRSRVRAWLNEMPFESAPIVMNPGAGWTSKRWPLDRFAAVARSIKNLHGVQSLVVWGGSEERTAAERIVASSEGSVIMAPPTSLQDLGEIFRLSRLCISSDTGPLHLAAAIGTPCVGLFGPVPASRNGPYGLQHISLEPPEHLRPLWKDRKTDTQSMLGIEVADVIAAVNRQLARAVAA